MTSTYWKEIVFDKASTLVSQTNVDALFLSLAASGILKIQNTNNGIKWLVGHQPPSAPWQNLDVSLIDTTIGEAHYKLDKYWMGLHLHPATRICVCTPAIPASLNN
jgi:hypothetical protein